MNNGSNTTLFTHVTAVTMVEGDVHKLNSDDNLLKNDDRVLKDGYVLVQGETGKILSVGNTRPEGNFDAEISCAGKLMMPGLVNCHTHLPMTLLRGFGGGNNLQDWLFKYIFPAEARLTPRAVRCGTQLAIAELLACGVTCVADMYDYCDVIATAVAESGINANLSRGITCFSKPDKVEDLVGIVETRALLDRWHKHGGGQIRCDLSLHAEYTSYEASNLWEYMAKLGEEYAVPIHIHISETKQEHLDCKNRHGKTPIQIFDQYGIWEQGGIAAHGVWTEPEDWALMAKKNISLAHNPVSNLKLASGFAPIADMAKQGVNIALGTDSVGSNNSHDLWEEIKLTGILHNGLAGDPLLVSGYDALLMATKQGGIALNRNTGVLAEGYDADLILVDLDHVSMMPCHDPVELLAFSTVGSRVDLTMCRGKILYQQGEYTTIDIKEMKKEVETYGVPCILGENPA